MNMKKHTFERIENKYILNNESLKELYKLIDMYFTKDAYPKSQITSVYYDTNDYRIIRSSIESELFKEKIRLRKYFVDDYESDCFIEIKRKIDGVVYKRRETMPLIEKPYINQIDKEIIYALESVDDLRPTCLITYYREAYVLKDDSSFRITLDRDIKYRFKDVLNFGQFYGDNVLDEDLVLLEVKSTYGYPTWFLKFLNLHKLYKTSFSKYGRAYQKFILEGENNYDKQLI